MEITKKGKRGDSIPFTCNLCGCIFAATPNNCMCIDAIEDLYQAVKY